MSLVYKLPYTYEDYKLWQGDWELIEGEAVAMAPIGPHQNLLLTIGAQIRSALGRCKNGCFVYAELDYIIDEYNVLRPDISVVCEKVEKFIEIPPKCVIEILSPSTKLKDSRIKFEIFEKDGVEFYMIVDYDLKKVKLFKLIDFKYRKIDEKIDGTMTIEFKDCEIELNVDEWWEEI